MFPDLPQEVVQQFLAEVPSWFLIGYVVVGLFIGDLLKRIGMPQWIIPANFIAGGVLGSWALLELPMHPLQRFMLGAFVGLASTGAHRVLKLINPNRS